jgi:hypothetical protein
MGKCLSAVLCLLCRPGGANPSLPTCWCPNSQGDRDGTGDSTSHPFFPHQPLFAGLKAVKSTIQNFHQPPGEWPMQGK